MKLFMLTLDIESLNDICMGGKQTQLPFKQNIIQRSIYLISI